VELYRLQRGLDVAVEIPGDFVELWHNPAIDFHFFAPMCDGSAEFYEQLTTDPFYSVEKQEYQFAAGHVAAQDQLLDVGCGWGHWAPYVSSADYRGVELSRSAVATCREKGLAVEARLVQDVAAETPAAFDIVASFQVLEHLADPRDFFDHCLRCVKPGGKLIISVPNADSFMGRRANNYLNYPPHHVSWWTLDSLQYLAAEFGLRIIDHHADAATGNEIAMHHAARIQGRIDRIADRAERPVRLGRMDRALLRAFDATGQVISRLGPLGNRPANGHSITAIFQKPV